MSIISFFYIKSFCLYLHEMGGGFSLQSATTFISIAGLLSGAKVLLPTIWLLQQKWSVWSYSGGKFSRPLYSNGHSVKKISKKQICQSRQVGPVLMRDWQITLHERLKYKRWTVALAFFLLCLMVKVIKNSSVGFLTFFSWLSKHKPSDTYPKSVKDLYTMFNTNVPKILWLWNVVERSGEALGELKGSELSLHSKFFLMLTGAVFFFLERVRPLSKKQGTVWRHFFLFWFGFLLSAPAEP